MHVGTADIRKAKYNVSSEDLSSERRADLAFYIYRQYTNILYFDPYFNTAYAPRNVYTFQNPVQHFLKIRPGDTIIKTLYNIPKRIHLFSYTRYT